MPAQDPFGFPSSPQPTYSPKPHTLIAQPGQEIRIKVSDRSGNVPGALPGDTRVSPSGAGDTRVSPSGSGDTRASPSGLGDTRVSPSGYGDTRVSPSGAGDTEPGDAFGFVDPKRVYPEKPMTVIARPGQEIRIIVQDDDTAG